jgi:hypothetical protein
MSKEVSCVLLKNIVLQKAEIPIKIDEVINWSKRKLNVQTTCLYPGDWFTSLFLIGKNLNNLQNKCSLKPILNLPNQKLLCIPKDKII